MKILIVHNDYGRYSGEEAVIDRMIEDLRKRGHHVQTLRRSSEHSRDRLLGKIRGFFAGIYSISGRRMMRKLLHDFNPDIVNIHNLYPFISPAVLFLCKRKGVPVVMTVHNYRLICPTGLFLRDGIPCENCLLKGNEIDCIRYNCEHSLFRSIGYALRNTVARCTKAYKNCVDYFCCLTEFQKRKLIQAGFDRDKILVFPNCVEKTEPKNEPIPECNTDYIGYVGRLSEEKGYDLILEVAHRHPEIEFRFAGTPRDNMQIMTAPNVKLCGQLNSKQLARFYADSRFIVIPSRCYEGFPVALLEAASHGRCCVAPNHGAFPDLMTDPKNREIGGRLFSPNNIDNLENTIIDLWNNKSKSEELGHIAKQNYEKRFSKEIVETAWIDFLQHVATNSETNSQNQ